MAEEIRAISRNVHLILIETILFLLAASVRAERITVVQGAGQTTASHHVSETVQSDTLILGRLKTLYSAKMPQVNSE